MIGAATMLTAARRVPLWAWALVALAAAAAAAAVAAGLQTVRLANERAAHAQTRAQWAHDAKRAAESFAADIQSARDDERRIAATQRGSLNVTLTDLDHARTDAAAARTAADRLRAHVAALAASCRAAVPASPAAAGSAPAAHTAGDLLADMQRRIDEAAGAIAAHADAARAAGLGCERDYDAVTNARDGDQS